MRPAVRCFFALLVVTVAVTAVDAQAVPQNVSVSAGPVLDAAGPKQRVAIKSVYLISCAKDNIAGTGFLLNNGLIVTNQHVVGTCEPDELQVISSASQRVTLTRVIIDKDRDLALLRPSRNILGGLELSAAKKPLPGTVVSTWGYPFLYNGYYPLLSVGYVAGYREVQLSNRRKVKHVIVNGAFNHGNSGGRFL